MFAFCSVEVDGLALLDSFPSSFVFQSDSFTLDHTNFDFEDVEDVKEHIKIKELLITVEEMADSELMFLISQFLINYLLM